MIKAYIKKPLSVQAVQWTGDNTNEIIDFGGTVNGRNTISDIGEFYLVIRTLEGDMKISIGDYVIRGTSGEYYPCKPDIFERLYEEQNDMTYKEIITYEEALEKQTAKKPNLEGDGYDDSGNIIYDTWICPGCEERYEVDYDDFDYCPKCGQKIDWSDIK